MDAYTFQCRPHMQLYVFVCVCDVTGSSDSQVAIPSFKASTGVAIAVIMENTGWLGYRRFATTSFQYKARPTIFLVSGGFLLEKSSPSVGQTFC